MLAHAVSAVFLDGPGLAGIRRDLAILAVQEPDTTDAVVEEFRLS